MKITLDNPISLNQLYRKGRNGIYRSKEAVVWQNASIYLIRSLMSKEKRTTIVGHCSVSVTYYRKDLRRWDIDNGLKLIFDTLVKAGAIADDNLIDDAHLSKQYVKGIKNNYVVIELY